MGQQYKFLSEEDIHFIQQQKLFYIASCSHQEVNLSPRGYDSLYVHDEKTLYMIDYIGSGNRTARDLHNGGEVTLLFNAFEGEPRILRCFCKGESIEKPSEQFDTLAAHFNEDMAAIRQIFIFNIYALESSCGMGVPIMQYQNERTEVRDYALKLAENGEFDQYVKDHYTPPDLSKL